MEGDIGKSVDEKERLSKEKGIAGVHVEKSREAEVVHAEAASRDTLNAAMDALSDVKPEVLDRIYDLASEEGFGGLKALLEVTDTSGSGRGDGED
ncbi:hypothetical protein L1987_85901 [Smallanthus sonchifolius]|uniref:Uncharacterized protein n=1 Tax=Smallanthus sonchifolius TaxID=185202 RepID=A0ACB8XYV3_9ASTR|nr:hypothetical protein L1987_85901 [Smallanthus sonchifolius]